MGRVPIDTEDRIGTWRWCDDCGGSYVNALARTVGIFTYTCTLLCFQLRRSESDWLVSELNGARPRTLQLVPSLAQS